VQRGTILPFTKIPSLSSTLPCQLMGAESNMQNLAMEYWCVGMRRTSYLIHLSCTRRDDDLIDNRMMGTPYSHGTRSRREYEIGRKPRRSQEVGGLSEALPSRTVEVRVYYTPAPPSPDRPKSPRSSGLFPLLSPCLDKYNPRRECRTPNRRSVPLVQSQVEGSGSVVL
jgi:hypothetical protein